MEQSLDPSPLPTMRMERDILEVVYKLGPIGVFNGVQSPATQRLRSKYTSDSEIQQLSVILNYLLEKRLLFPYFSANGSGEELRDTFARGITPDGVNRLQRLRVPVATWIVDNWFPLMVASGTVSSTIGNIVLLFLR